MKNDSQVTPNLEAPSVTTAFRELSTTGRLRYASEWITTRVSTYRREDGEFGGLHDFFPETIQSLRG
jgi:hypothetical protein